MTVASRAGRGREGKDDPTLEGCISGVSDGEIAEGALDTYRVQLDRRALVVEAGDGAREPLAVTLTGIGTRLLAHSGHLHRGPNLVHEPGDAAPGHLRFRLVLALSRPILRTVRGAWRVRS